MAVRGPGRPKAGRRASALRGVVTRTARRADSASAARALRALARELEARRRRLVPRSELRVRLGREAREARQAWRGLTRPLERQDEALVYRRVAPSPRVRELVLALRPPPETPPAREAPPEPPEEATRPSDERAWTELEGAVLPDREPDGDVTWVEPFLPETDYEEVFGEPGNVQGLQLVNVATGKVTWVRFSQPLESWSDLYTLQRQFYGGPGSRRTDRYYARPWTWARLARAA